MIPFKIINKTTHKKYIVIDRPSDDLYLAVNDEDFSFKELHTKYIKDNYIFVGFQKPIKQTGVNYNDE